MNDHKNQIFYSSNTKYHYAVLDLLILYFNNIIIFVKVRQFGLFKLALACKISYTMAAKLHSVRNLTLKPVLFSRYFVVPQTHLELLIKILVQQHEIIYSKVMLEKIHNSIAHEANPIT